MTLELSHFLGYMIENYFCRNIRQETLSLYRLMCDIDKKGDCPGSQNQRWTPEKGGATSRNQEEPDQHEDKKVSAEKSIGWIKFNSGEPRR